MSERTPEQTKEHVRLFIELAQSVSQLIREAGQIPSGELYSLLMGGIDLNTYNLLVESMKRAGVIRESNHMLIWTGPAKGKP